MTARRLLIRCDAAPWLGGGHVMRCLTLADVMAGQGWRVAFAATPETGETVPALVRSGVPVIPLDDPRDATECVARAGPGWDAVLVDQYALGPDYETALRTIAGRVAVIDDLLRPHDCDLLVDPTHGRKAAEYAGLVPAHAVLGCGPDYALLRPEFARLRPDSLARRDGGSVRKLLISLGLTDVGGITGQVLERVLPVFDGQIDVVLGAGAESRPRIEELVGQTPSPSGGERSQAAAQTGTSHARVTLHVDTPDVADLMAGADLAIGAGGTSSWERCALGLPTLQFVLADNQRDVAAGLEASGAARTVTRETLGAALTALRGDGTALQGMAEAAAGVCDGTGSARVVDLLAQLAPEAGQGDAPLQVLPAVLSDRMDVWLWRNEEQARALSGNPDPIPWDDHCTWWDRAMSDPDRTLLMIVRGGQRIGHLRLDRLAGEGRAEQVSITLNPDFRGQGLGAPVLAAGLVARSAARPGVIFHAAIHDANLASRRIFEACGFRHMTDIPPFGQYILEGIS
jgi:UDP-2,4-diacetamido-2,4,6-trideoxy-beta-L-altropyranose hydrolase